MPLGRKRITSIAAVGLLTAGIGMQGSAPASAEPDIDTVKKQVTSLYESAEQAAERYNEARDSLKASKTKLKSLHADVRHQQRVVKSMRTQVASFAVEQYQSGGLSTASQMVLSNNPDTFIDNLNALSSYNSQRGQVMEQFKVALKRLKLRQTAADDQVAAMRKTEKQAAKEKAAIDEKAKAAKALLGRLEAKERAKLDGAPSEAVPTDVPASGRGGAALRYALAQVGDSYVWGAAGPSAFDCSGLTMAAWGSAGVGLPHSSSGQMGSGTRVSASQLQPGDLVFYYSPVHHVGMYIGGGKIVHAANPGAGVRIDGLYSMPFSGAVRPG